MLVITKNLRAYAVKHWDFKKSGSASELRALVGRKLFKGAITAAAIEKINAGSAPEKKSGKPPEKKAGRKPLKKSAEDAAAGAAEIDRQVKRTVRATLKKLGIDPARAGSDGSVNPADAFNKATRIRVKEAAENYSTTKTAAIYPMMRGIGGKGGPHPMGGQPARIGDVNLDHPSDRDKAVMIAFLRYQVGRSPLARATELPRWLRMTQHDRELLLYAAHNEKWTGRIESRDGGTTVVKRRKLTDFQIKTLLDDSVSGGIEITPVVFDDALVITPVLYGELFPFVRVETLARGRRVKGGAIVNPTFTSGVGEGTAITPFNTASFVTAFDTGIFPAVAAIELGQDFEEDSPVDLAGQIVEQFGLKALEWLDRVIAVGNGFNEPLGIFNTTGTTLVNSVFGAGGPYTVSDFEGLMFGVPKQFRTEAGAYLAYLSNDYTYRKARSIQVGPGDERRVFGMNHAAYELFDTQYKVQNDIPDGYAAYANLRRYRMYRRLGMQVRVETGGRQLALSNTRLIVIRMRYGGQLELGGAAAVMKDGQVF